jgi:2-dehydropantoate 2-reductase
MRFLIVGAGSTGGYFGGRLAQAGRDVSFLVRPRRAAQLRATGLRIASPQGAVALTPTLVAAGEITAPYDAVLLTVKAYSLETALDDFAAAIGPETMILPVLNGMRHVDVLAARFGQRAVAGCVCKIMATLDKDGGIVQLTKLHDLVYGELDGSASPRMQRLDAVMQGAGFDAALSSTIAREMWEKWTLLAALGGVNCLMRGNIGEIVAAPGGPDIIVRVLDEVLAIVNQVGQKPSDGFVASIRGMLTTPGSAQASSMFRDLQQGNPVEADQIIGDLLARGAAAGITAPLLAASYANLAIYQRRLAGT